MHEERLFLYHLQRTQTLNAADCPLRVDFCRWFLKQSTNTPNFSGNILFTDEANFKRDRDFNLHDSHVWHFSNLHATRQHTFREQFSVNVWEGTVNVYLMWFLYDGASAYFSKDMYN